MKSIFISLNQQEALSNILTAARSLASKTGSSIIFHYNVQTLTLWHTLSEEERMRHPDVLSEAIEADMKIDRLLESKEFQGLDCHKLITHGIAYVQIILKSAELNADLIMMGIRGNVPGNKPFIDSTVQKVMRESSIPVMTVRDGIGGTNWNKVLVPLSFNEGIHESFTFIHELTLELGSIVHLLYVNVPQKFKETSMIEKQIQTFESRYPDLKFESGILDSLELETGILEYIERIRPDYLAMVTHNHRHDPKYLISTTETIVNRSNLPLLSVPILKHSGEQRVVHKAQY